MDHLVRVDVFWLDRAATTPYAQGMNYFDRDLPEAEKRAPRLLWKIEE